MVGVSAAIRLRQDGHEVVLIDPFDSPRSASYGNAGALNPSSVTPLTVPGLLARAPRLLLDRRSPLYLRWRYLPRALPWLIRFLSHATHSKSAAIADGLSALVGQCVDEHQALAAGTLAEPLLTERAFTALYPNRSAFEADRYLWSERQRLGLEWRVLEGERFAKLEPELARHGRFAVRMEGHGFIADPGQYLKALQQHFQSLGGCLLEGMVDRIVVTSGQARAVRVGGREIAVDKVVIAAGIRSGELTRPLGLRIPMESERGYHVEFVEPSFVPRGVVHLTDLGVFMTPMLDRLRCTSAVELAGYRAPENAKIHGVILDKITGVFPDLRWKSVNFWMGHRPSLVDSLPVIGNAPGLGNVYLGYGHNHVGMMSGPRTGRLLADLIAGRKPNVDLSPFDPGRFS